MATSGLLLSTGALTALYSQNAFAQVFNTDRANVEISEAKLAEHYVEQVAITPMADLS